ncbi:hypothetical protein FJ651_10870 [Paucihalobacter ruber]|uniref:Uncharacterized protein n=1 Tax=Paucihalobacter ruber TaxID=2567861 RepID=A0A506PGR9_9FLAO|nr:DUF6090 family protein [Paucihalobacter ruber]TPV32809.1 hypothetical protein FJ651_10870 [Paucihalobacter ruber]
MIKFFRKIRYNLMVHNKSSKYLKYAIGEIILVVIGILIALQINNWNEEKKNSASERQYYCRILEDFELEKQLIAELNEKSNYRINTSKEILLDLDAGTKDKHYLINQFLLANRSEVYEPRNVTFKDLISSGNLKLINDINLKNSLIQYYSELENKQFQLKQNRDEITKTVFELVKTNIDIGAIQEFEYVHRLLGPEILQILPQNDWTKDKNSDYYKKFQLALLFNIAMADREKQHLTAITNLMEHPYKLLAIKCSNKN